MKEDLMIECLRATSSDRKEFVDESNQVRFKEGIVGIAGQKGLMYSPTSTTPKSGIKESDDDDDEVKEFDDQMGSDLPDEFEDPDAPVAVIDTDATGEDNVGEPKSYIGKYIGICPICLKPLFMDNPSGDVYCPVCDEDVTIEKAEGQVTEVGDSTPADPEVEGEPTTDEPESEEPSTDEDPSDSEDDDKSESLDKGCDKDKEEGCNKSDKEEGCDKDESLKAPASTKAYSDYTAADLDPVRCGGDPNKILQDYKDGKISDGNFTQYIAESKRSKTEDVDISVDPSGNTRVQYTADNGEDPCPECTADTDPVSSVPSDVPNDPVEVDEFDTDTFDGQVEEALGELYEDKNLKYESKSVKRFGKGVVVEGVIKANHRTLPIKFKCTESKMRTNKFIVEGLRGYNGRFVIECKYYKDEKKLVSESLNYKLLTKIEGKSKVVQRRK